MSVKVFISNLASNMEIKKKQQFILDVLEGGKIQFESVDVAANRDDLNRMREIVGDPTALAPQIVNGSTYCGGYNEFEMAVEDKKIKEFLKLE